jgi:hypothetical protein
LGRFHQGSIPFLSSIGNDYEKAPTSTLPAPAGRRLLWHS